MPRVKGQIDQHKRAAILAAARRLIVYPPAPPPILNMAQLARKSGVAKQTLYNHFGTKAALIAEMESGLAEARLAKVSG